MISLLAREQHIEIFQTTTRLAITFDIFLMQKIFIKVFLNEKNLLD